MKIGCLQFSPLVGDIDNNLNRADAVLNRADPDDLDLLVLPELAFSGYNFRSLQEISPFLEPSGSGVSSLWARTVALKYDCTVIVGYPEKVEPTIPRWPSGPEYYNAAIVVNGDGETVANYRKTHLFPTDETWAVENPEGFYGGFLVGLGHTAIGICMDLNPYKFEAPWHAFEFAFHILEMEANLVVLSMAWRTREDARMFSRMPQEPDMETLMYWVTRLEPLIRSENGDEVIIVFANRCGTESEAVYAGTSAVMGIKDGEVLVYGMLGRGDKELLVVDTNAAPYGRLVLRPDQGHGDTATLEKLSPAPSKIEESTQSGPSGNSSNSETKGDRKSPTKDSKEGSPAKDIGDQSPSKNPPKRIDTTGSRRGLKKLSLQTDDYTLYSPKGDSPIVHTPTGPSPTPISLRPRFTIPPTESVTMKYLEQQVPSSHLVAPRKNLQGDLSSVNYVDSPFPTGEAQLLFSPPKEPIQILGGHVTVSQVDSMASPVSPSMFWVPSKALINTPYQPQGWNPGAEFGMTAAAETGSTVSRSDPSSSSRTSNRQYPVSNPATAVPQTAFPQTAVPRTAVPQTAFPRSRAASVEKRWRSRSKSAAVHSTSEKDSKRSDSNGPGRPASPKSRNASRSRGPETDGASMESGDPDLSTIAVKLGEIAQRVGSAQGRHTPQPSRARSGSVQPNRVWTTEDVMEQRAQNQSQNMIPIAACPSLLASSQDTQSGGDSATRSDDSGGSARAAERQRSMSNAGGGRNGDRRAPRAGSATPGRTRTVSRGRQLDLAPSQSPGPTATPSRQTPVPEHRSASRRAGSSQPVDLTQFQVIEEFISPSCPLHGAGPHSHGPHDHTHVHHGAQGSPIPRPRTSGPVMGAINRPAQTAVTPSATSQNGMLRFSESVESLDSSYSSSSPRTPFDPQTPKAMKFPDDTRSAPLSGLSPALDAQAAGLDVSRPKSAVW